MSIHYKFRSAREYDTITVDGGFISLFDLKKAIIEAKKLGKSMDLDLEVVNAQTNEAYTDESTLIPKNTSVIVRRVPTTKMASIVQPASAPTHVAVMQEKPIEKPIEAPPPQQYQSQYVQQYAQPQVAPLVVPAESGTPSGGEEDRIMALINQADDWHATGTTKDTGMTPGGHRGGGKFTRQYEQKVPPPNYICHRCNQPGHFINQCPTNGDPSFDIPKVKKPTGIPRMYLKPVAGGDSRPSLILPGGQFAVMAANEEALQKEVAKTKQVDTSIPDSLRCPLCGGLLNDAVLIPCCGYSFCEECIRPQYPNDVINCPMCHKTSSASRLVPNLTLRTAVEQFKKSRDEMKINRVIPQRPPEVPRTMPTGPGMPLRSIPTVVSDTPAPIMPLPSVVSMPVKTEVQPLPTTVTEPTPAANEPPVEEVQLDGNDSPPYSPSKGLADDGSEDKSPRAKSPAKDEKSEDKENKDTKDDKRGDDKGYQGQGQGQYQYNNYYGQYNKGGRYCFVCGSPAHQARECPNRQAIEAAYSAYGYYMDPAAAAYYGAAYPGYGYDPRMQGYQDDYRRRRRSRSPRGRSRSPRGRSRSPRGRSPRRSPRRSRSRGRSGDRRRRSHSRDRGTKRKRSTSREEKRDDKSKRARTDDKDRKDDKSPRDDKPKKDDRKEDKSRDDKDRASSKDKDRKSEPKPTSAEEVTKMDVDEPKEQDKDSTKSKPKEDDRRSRDDKDRKDSTRDDSRKDGKKDERKDRDDKDRRSSDKRDEKDRKEDKDRRDLKKDERKEDKKEEKRDHAERKDDKPKSDKYDEKKDDKSKSDRRDDRKEDKPRGEKKDEKRDERKEESRKEDKKDKKEDKRDDKKDDRRSSDKRDDKRDQKKEDKHDDKKDDRRSGDKRDERKDDKKDDRRDDRRDSKRDEKKNVKKDDRRSDDKRIDVKKDERRDEKKSSDKKDDKPEAKKEDKREDKKDENSRKRKLDESGSSTGSAAKKPRLESAVRVVQMSSDREEEPRVKIIPPDHTLKERENKEKRKSLIHEILTGRRDKEDKEKLRKSGEKKDDKKEREVTIEGKKMAVTISPKSERKNKDLKRSEERRDRRR